MSRQKPQRRRVGVPKLALAALVCLSLIGASVGGCRGGLSGPTLRKLIPNVKLANFDITDIDFNKVEVHFVFDIVEPPADFTLEDIRYALDFEGKQVLDMRKVRGEAYALPGGAVRLPVNLNYAEIANIVESAKGQDDVGYTLRGDFAFDTKDGTVRVPFQEKGRFPIVRAPEVAFKAVRVGDTEVDAGTVAVFVDLDVSYPDGGKPITVTEMTYACALGGAEVAKGRVKAAPSIPGGGSATVTLPLVVKLTELGKAVFDGLVNSKAIDVAVKASAQVTTPWGPIGLEIDKDGQVNVASP